MSEIKINYDLIHVIKETKGIKKCPKGFSVVTKPLAFLYPSAVFIGSINDQLPANLIITATAIATFLSLGTEQLFLSLLIKKNNMELAKIQLDFLVKMLESINVQTDINLLLNSKVYYKDYKLKKDSPKGIIRNRYINIPSYNYKGDEIISSVKEEHVLTTSEYILSIGEPQKKDEKVYSRVYRMA